MKPIIKKRSFLIAVGEAIRGAFSEDEITEVYINKTVKNFVRPSIMVQYVPNIERPAMRNEAFRRISFDIVCFAPKTSESYFQEWSMEIGERLSETLRWLTVSGVPHQCRSYEDYIEQGQYLEYHFLVDYSLYVEYIDPTPPPNMLDLEEDVFLMGSVKIGLNERND